MPQVSLSDFILAARSGIALVSFPTDTVPALATRPDQANLIFTTKQRSPDKPLILMGAEAADLWPFVTGTPEQWEIWKQVAVQHWPGALTLVLPASDRVPPAVNPGDPTTIGIRVPNHAIARAVLAQTGPLATTSVNRSGEPALKTMAAIEAQFPQILTLAPGESEELATRFPTAPTQASDTPSTVAKWTSTGWEILRQGAIIL
ncbi:MAG: L-threonylcarbamoyladenylate synthase [Leptolyngbyaceae cyanobacterium bins.59]|nr:L-threonylcarbamoyladenylate synthase [Leptolyngbyaceae cyanobacterium bins.59]